MQRRLVSPLIVLGGMLVATLSHSSPSRVCSLMQGLAGHRPALVSSTSGRTGVTVDLGDVTPALIENQHREYYLVVERGQQADAELPRSEFAIVPAERPIECGRRWAYRLEWDFSGSSLPPGPFKRDVSLFARRADGTPGEEAPTRALAGTMHRAWITAVAASTDAVAFTVILKNGGDRATAAITVGLSIPGAWIIENNLCDGQTLQPNGQCQFTLRAGDQAYASRATSLQVSDGEQPVSTYALKLSSDGRQLQLVR